jgi:hypothetical protein
LPLRFFSREKEASWSNLNINCFNSQDASERRFGIWRVFFSYEKSGNDFEKIRFIARVFWVRSALYEPEIIFA